MLDIVKNFASKLLQFKTNSPLKGLTPNFKFWDMPQNQKTRGGFPSVWSIQGWWKPSWSLPMMSNQRGMPGGSTAITPIMWATGSLSITVKVKNDSSNEIGSGDGLGLEIHSIWSRVVDDFWGRPLSTALIYKIWAEGIKTANEKLHPITEALIGLVWNWTSFKHLISVRYIFHVNSIFHLTPDKKGNLFMPHST